MNTLKIIGREEELFKYDILKHNKYLLDIVSKSRFLIIGGAGSIGQAVTKEIFKRNPKTLHIVDVSENNMVELVRDIRSYLGYSGGEFRTFSIDCNGLEFESLLKNNDSYDYVFNLSALKHVRSEKDPYTLMRMIMVNIFNSLKILKLIKNTGVTNYFCVSTDKAANPVNMMGASKRIMEMLLMRESLTNKISMARFANVAFSDGSLLHGFNQRFIKFQPFSAPKDVRRYFVSPQEAGELCLLSCLMGENRDIFFPKLDNNLDHNTFSEIACRYLIEKGYEPYECRSEDEARNKATQLIKEKKWPCYFFNSDTSGEKSYEEFYTIKEKIDINTFDGIGIIKNDPEFNNNDLKDFLDGIQKLRKQGTWNKSDILELYKKILPNFEHIETGKNLDQKM